MYGNPLVEVLLGLVGNAGLYVLWLLVGLSVWATAIIIERALYYRKILPPIMDGVQQTRDQLLEGIDEDWDPPQLGALGELYQSVWRTDRTMFAANARLRDGSGRLRRDLLKRANVLGTLGANTPFIGLLGTVFGIIRAFEDLSATTGKGADAVMAGIAEALVATGMGLLVAIPCVLFYNAYARKAQQAAEQIEETGAWLAAEAKIESDGSS